MKGKLNTRFFFMLILLFVFILGHSILSRSTFIQAQVAQILDLTIAHSGGEGPWMLIAEGIAGIIRDGVPGCEVTTIPGGSDANIARLQNGEVDLAISAIDSANNAKNGWGSFSEPVPLDSVNTIACFYLAKSQFVVLNTVGINSIEEIKEKKIPLKISVGKRGSGMEIGAARILTEYGITYKDIENWGGRVVYFSPAESIRMMGNGQLNAFLLQSVVPFTSLTELSLKRDFKILPIRKEYIENMIAKFDYAFGTIPKGSYKGVTEDIPSIAIANGVFASGKLDEQTVFLITKALIDNIERLRQIHSQIENITPEFMAQEMVFPLHPGSKRAYQK